MKQKGFTLIELLVVVAIIGILAAVGVVAYSGYTSGAKISVVKANHKTVKNYIINEINKCYNLDIEFDSITNKSYQSNPSTNCSTNRNCSNLKSSGSPKGNPGAYFDTAKCPFEYYSLISNPFENNNVNTKPLDAGSLSLTAFRSMTAFSKKSMLEKTSLNFSFKISDGYSFVAKSPASFADMELSKPLQDKILS